MDSFALEHVRELALADELDNLESVDDHADMEHHVVLRVGLVAVVGVHLRLHGVGLFSVLII